MCRHLNDELAKLPFVALRLGELAFNGWKIRPKRLSDVGKKGESSLTITVGDLYPQIQQKGVDMRIGMDIAALTLRKHVQIIVLVSGDSDLLPAMKFARREGCQLFLCPLGHYVKPTMYEHSDLSLALVALSPSKD
ncbi:MAG: NYN domain-containing protein [Azoarcus sp.]|nr:NYN domain-containing protein [Azoarcus sp.]